MTAREKAFELIAKYYPEVGMIQNDIRAKKCALIAVDVIKSENQFLDNFKSQFTEHLVNRLKYWEEVESVIKNL